MYFVYIEGVLSVRMFMLYVVCVRVRVRVCRCRRRCVCVCVNECMQQCVSMEIRRRYGWMDQ